MICNVARRAALERFCLVVPLCKWTIKNESFSEKMGERKLYFGLGWLKTFIGGKDGTRNNVETFGGSRIKTLLLIR